MLSNIIKLKIAFKGIKVNSLYRCPSTIEEWQNEPNKNTHLPL